MFPLYSVIRLGDGQESTVSTSDLAPYPRSPAIAEELLTDVASHPTTPSRVDSVLPNCLGDPPPAAELPGFTSRRRALTPFSHRQVQISLSWVGRQESGNPLIVLVIGPYNFKGGRV